MAKTKYRLVTVNLDAGQEQAVDVPVDYVALVSATDDTTVTIRTSEEGTAERLVMGLFPDELGIERFWLGNTGIVANTVVVACGSEASIRDNRPLIANTETPVDITKLNGASAVGQKTAANSLSVTMASDQPGLTMNLTQINGASAVGQKTKANSVSTTLASDQGALQVSGPTAAGAVPNTPPVLVGGNKQSDSTVATLRMTSNAELIVAGLNASGAPSSGAPVYIAGRSKDDAQVFDENDCAGLTTDLSGALLTRPYAVVGAQWQYPAIAGGIVNTVAPYTLKAAVAGKRNYITALHVMADALGAATELVIRDGTGTILWRINIPVAGMAPVCFTFPTPLYGGINSLLEVLTLTATVTGGVYVGAYGYTQ